MKPFSIIIPLHNEEQIVEREIMKLMGKIAAKKAARYQIILIENGSKDRTYSIARNLASRFPKIQTVKLKNPSYGAALKKGISLCLFQNIIQLDIDLIDTDFVWKSLRLLDTSDFVVGSKTLPRSRDSRLFPRILVTRLVSFVIRRSFGYTGTDTHGVKAYRKRALKTIVAVIKSTHHFFDTEILLRAQYQGYTIKEIPVSISEMRRTRFTLGTRVWQSLREFRRLLQNKADIVGRYRPLMVADDFGYDALIDRKVWRLAVEKKISLVSVMANRLVTNNYSLSTRKKIPVAVHINLTEGCPVSAPKHIPSLVNERGIFYPLPSFILRLLVGSLNQQELRREITAQVNRLRNYGFRISELNSHQHLHALSPISEIFRDIARKYRIPVIRSYCNLKAHTPIAKLKRITLRSIATASALRYNLSGRLPDAWHIKGGDAYIMSWESKGFDARRINSGNTKLIIHPFLPFDSNRRYYDYFNNAKTP